MRDLEGIEIIPLWADTNALTQVDALPSEPFMPSRFMETVVTCPFNWLTSVETVVTCSLRLSSFSRAAADASLNREELVDHFYISCERNAEARNERTSR